MLPVLIRVGRYEMFVGRCPGQMRPATRKNGAQGRTFWLPGLSINIHWGDQ